MIQLTMFSSAEKVAGQGVGSAYIELLGLLKTYHAKDLTIKVNQYSKTQISHYHTIDPLFFMSTFFDRRFGRRIGYVHFLPSTLNKSIHLPKWVELILYKYVIAFYKRMDHLVVVNPSFIKELTNYGIMTETISYIPNFVSKTTFFPLDNEKTNNERKLLGISEKQFVVFGAGQIQERKGVEDFIKLAEKMPEVQFIWAGGFSFGKITDGYDKFNEWIKNAPKNLLFPGIIKREEMCTYYNIADVFLLPSYDELFPMCILEALSCGKPVILRDLDLYLPVLEGYYEPASNRKEMENEIKKMMNNSNYYQKSVQKAIAGSEFYSEERLAKIWLEFYQQQSNIL